MSRAAHEYVSGAQGLQILRKQIAQNTHGGQGGHLLKQFKQFRFKARSSNNSITVAEFKRALALR